MNRAAKQLLIQDALRQGSSGSCSVSFFLPMCLTWLVPCSYAVVPLATLGAMPVFVGNQEGGWRRSVHPMLAGNTGALHPQPARETGMSACALEAPCPAKPGGQMG